MDKGRGAETYKHQRTTCDIQESRTVARRDQECTYLHMQRQQDRLLHSGQTRIKQISSETGDNMSDFTSANRKELHVRSSTHSREGSSPGRFPVQARSPSTHRATNFSTSIPKSNDQFESNSPSRLIFDQIQLQIDQLPFIHSRSESGENKHIHSEMEQVQDPLCISSSQHDSQNTLQVEKRGGGHPNSNSTRLANKELVLSTTTTSQEENQTRPSRAGPIRKDENRKTVLPRREIPSLRTSVIRANIPKDFSKSLKNKLVNPTKKSTTKHYQQMWKGFKRFISERKLELNQQSIYEFFNHLIDRNLKLGSLLQYRSALSRPLKHILPELDLIQDPVIKDLIQFIKSNKIKDIKQFPFWSLDDVLLMFDSLAFKKQCIENNSIFF